MVRNTLLILFSGVQLSGVLASQTAGAEDLCGKVRGGQYADEQVCANVLSFPDGKPARAAMLDSIPESYPWLFRFSDAHSHLRRLQHALWHECFEGGRPPVLVPAMRILRSRNFMP